MHSRRCEWTDTGVYRPVAQDALGERFRQFVVHGDLYQLNSQLAGSLQGALIAVELPVTDTYDAAVGALLKTIPAWACRDIYRGVIDEYAILGGLDNGVRLGVNGGYAMSRLHHVAFLCTMRQAANRAIVAGG